MEAAPGLRGFPPPGVDRGASLPRRHISSAAGALAALLLAVQAPADAQDATGQLLRGSLGVQDEPDAPGAPAASGSGQNQAADNSESMAGEDSAGGLGGTGDEAPPQSATPALGGLGDEPRETTQPEEVGIQVEELGLAPPARAVSEARQIHSALLPEPHDLDPFVPIGFRIGSFLLFPEAEIGTDMTNNVLATHFDARSDIGPEVKPKLRVDSDWSRHSLTFEANADRIWYSEFPIADVKNYQLLLRGRLDVTSRTRLSGEIEKSHVQEGPSSISITDISNANSAVEEKHA